MKSFRICECGKKNIIAYETGDNKIGVTCLSCDRNTGTFYTESEALFHWNNNIDIKIIIPLSDEDIIDLITVWNIQLNSIGERLLCDNDKVIKTFKMFAENVIKHNDEISF